MDFAQAICARRLAETTPGEPVTNSWRQVGEASERMNARAAMPVAGDVLSERYRIEHRIAQGGMAHVLAASHVLTEKRLAIKCLLPSHSCNDGGVQRFMREARAAGRIRHRHVVDVFDVGTFHGVPFIVMPRLEGKTLTQLLHDETLAVDALLIVLLRAMEGVRAAHAAGIIHRDLKPCNIFVCPGVGGRLDDPRVLDFGICDDMNAAHCDALGKEDVVMGTPFYMALEQLTGERDVDRRADIYALGVTLYEALAGEVPHRAEDPAALALRLRHVQPKHLATLRPDLPVGLSEAVMRALHCDREQRYADIASFSAELAPYADAKLGRTCARRGLRCARPRTANAALTTRLS
jgi:eukaryotic-like serine/threonine-protein kinase